LDYDL